jgi:uncharacterized repeat protein (TIGR01451 family)
MFKKLLSNLPFNPSLIGQVSFYAKRMRNEAKVRRTGLCFVLLAFAVQLFAVISPPEPTLAESGNDIVRGGFTTREQAVNYCRRNTQDFAELLAYYKVTCEDLEKAATKTIRSTDYNKRLDSLGRVPQGPKIERTGKATDEYAATINGRQYYMKNLWAWDSGTSSTYKVLETKNSEGATVMVMYNCGNIVTIDKYVPPVPEKPVAVTDICPNIAGVQTKKEECDVCPNVPGEQLSKNECYPCPEAKTDSATTACLELTKTAGNRTQKIQNADGTLALAGDTIVYTLSVTNTGTQEVKDFVFEEDISDILEYANVVELDGGTADENNIVSWPKADISPSATVRKNITVKVKDPIPQTPVSASDPASFDLVMNNVFYGTAVNIKLPAGTGKNTEVLVQTLPNTGPGLTMSLGFGLAAMTAYFYMRSRLLAKELDIVRTEYTSTGGL